MVTVVIMVDSCGLWDFLRRWYEFLRRIFGDDLKLIQKTQFNRKFAEERYGSTDLMPTNLVQFRQTHGRNTRNHEQYENANHFGLARLLT